MTLSAYAMASLFVVHRLPAPVALAAGLATGLAVGLANGALVGAAKLPPFIATLGMLSVARGLAFWVNDGDNITVAWRDAGSAFAGFRLLGDYPMVAVLLLGFAASVLMARFRWGRYVYAVGGNEEAARFAGLRIGAIKAGIYAAAGLFSAAAGCTYALKYGTTLVTMGNGYELQIIAACAIGGVSFSGGQGSVAGSVIGAAILQTLYELLLQLRVPGDRIEIFYGAAIVLAVGIDQLRRGGIPARWFGRSAT
jgi:ribose transport system permease protein